jgi:hypothetical protein
VHGLTNGTGCAVEGQIANSSSVAAAIYGTTSGYGPAVHAISALGNAVVGSSRTGRGAVLSSTVAQLQLAPASGSHPSIGAAGDLFVDSNHDLWFCKGDESWVKLA